MPEAPDNGYDNDSDEEDQYVDTDDLGIIDHYKNQFLTKAENKSCTNDWIAVNDLQPNECVLERYQQPYFNPNKVRVGVKMLISLAHWSEYVEC